jgi:feruloyl esterase
MDDMQFAQEKNPADIATWQGNLSPFKSRGNKLITFNGMADSIISSQNSQRYWEHVSDTMNQSSPQMDSWFRHFRISGMDHCQYGHGATQIGQSSSTDEVKFDPNRNIILQLVRWVEEGIAPDTLLGTHFKSQKVDGKKVKVADMQRRHCRYPYRTTYLGKGDYKNPDSWTCVKIPGSK